MQILHPEKWGYPLPFAGGKNTYMKKSFVESTSKKENEGRNGRNYDAG
jgi:hypothetical protein